MAATAGASVDNGVAHSIPDVDYRQTVIHRIIRAPEFGVGVALVLMYLFFAIVGGSHGFLTLRATASWLNTASQLGILAVPVGLLMISGSFDLSIGSMVGAGSITVGLVTGYLHHGLWLSFLIAAAVAVAVGLANGLLVTRTALPSFIATLATGLVVAGFGLTLSLQMAGSSSITVAASGFAAKLFNGTWGPFSVSTLWWFGVAAIAGWVLAKTRSGSWISAKGGDLERARRAGVPTARLTISLFVCSAAGGALVGVLQAIQYTTGDPTTGQSYIFEAAIVVVIGGVLISGGYGTVLGVMLGTALYGVVDAGLFYTGWDTNYVSVLIGILMVLAVLTNDYVRRLATTSGQPKGARR
jgi:simple sugar transport system permease protein